GERVEVTDASGSYEFTDLEPGSYTVAEVPQEGWLQTAPLPDPDTGRRVHRVELSSGEVVAFRDFGNVNSVSLHGSKWHDLNANGLWDDGEPGVPNWTIYLDLNNNGVLDKDDFGNPTEPTTVTLFDNPDTKDVDETGVYWFNDLLPGTYRVRELPRDGWHQTFPANGSYTVDADDE